MKVLSWFRYILKNEFAVKILEDSISAEGNELYLEEVDESLIPIFFRKDLPESLLFETVVGESEAGIEWMGVVGMDLKTRIWLIQAILKDGELVLLKRLERGHEND